MNAGLGSLRTENILEVHGRLYLEREGSILHGCCDLIPEVVKATVQWVWEGEGL